MSDPFVAEIRIFTYTFAPKGWAFCDGQLLPLSQNTALFSLLGTFYGGDGKSTFALPDMQGRVPMHAGTFNNPGPGLSGHSIGEMGGEDFVTLLTSEIPVHSHVYSQSVRAADNLNPVGLTIGTGTAVYAPPPVTVTMNPLSLPPAGGSLPHNNLQPYVTLQFCIALQGVFPPRQ
ncbi:MAG TPA: tail fiber protein [Pyrinomonadaceae bacterium]|jgi:microcystin-dependent protein|nr:tail fiber protein [Pyrinomonadaceae bacterium]